MWARPAYSTQPERPKLTFRSDGDNIVDNETGSQWNILGKATQGPLKGSRLNPVIHAKHFWFAWGAFKPETKNIGQIKRRWIR